MEPVGIDRTHILVLNYNGRALLAECLPSIVEAAAHASIACKVSVVDNDSTDDSIDYLKRSWPAIPVIREPNRGLASLNQVLARCDEPVVLLLNNDVKLDRDSIDPLVRSIENNPDALFSAPLCWDFEGTTYEGMKTWVKSRYGFPQGLCRIPGHERGIHEPGLTASAGPVLAVDRVRFLELGGYDPLYFPGRIEDLDLGFRAWMAGWKGYYVPESVAYHQGFGSFGKAFGQSGCDRLAARNTLLFVWKNLGGQRLWSHFAWLPIRLAHAVIFGRPEFAIALREALTRIGEVRRARKARFLPRNVWLTRQEAFFEEFGW